LDRGPQITARAGLTTRTFLRNFADKREVLFGEQPDIAAFATSLVDEAPDDWDPARHRGRVTTQSGRRVGGPADGMRPGDRQPASSSCVGDAAVSRIWASRTWEKTAKTAS